MITAALLALLLAQDESVIRSSVVNVQVPVTILDKKGKYVTGLTGKDFELFDSGFPQKIQVDEAAHPISMVVAVQSSSNARDVLNTIRQASSLLLPLVAGDMGEVSVVAFDQRVEVLAPFTSDPAEIKIGFSKLKSGGGPHHLDDAAMESMRMLQARGAERKKILLLIGEGFDQGSAVTAADVFTVAELNGVLIYTIKMKPAIQPASPAKNPVPPGARTPMPMGEVQTPTTDARIGAVSNDVFRGLMADNELSAYAQFTGARAQNFSNQRTLEQAMEIIGKEIHSQYLLSFAPQGREPGYHPIIVRISATPGLEVRARRGYWLATQVLTREVR